MTMPDRIRGVVPALLTPFDSQGKVNGSILGELMAFQLQQGVAGFFVGGTTGEGLLLSVEERRFVAELVVREAGGQVPVIVHVGAATTESTIALARHAEAIGADAVAALIPPFYAYDSAAIKEHYLLVGAATTLPFYVYTGERDDVVALLRDLLTEMPTLRGIKATTRNLYLLSRLIYLDGGSLNVLSGADEVALAALAVGADALVGSTYNALPGLYVRLYAAAQTGDLAEARRLQAIAHRVLEVLLSGPVIPRTRELVRLLGFEVGDSRRPFRPLSDAERQEFRRAMVAAGLGELIDQLRPD